MEQKEEEKKSQKTWLKFGSAVLGVFIAIVVSFSLWLTIDRLSGYNASLFGLRLSVISSESMSRVHEDNIEFLAGHDDRYYKNDMVIAFEVKSLDELDIYDVILFLDDNLGLICHRIVRIDEDAGKIWTKGDANNVMDGVVEFDEVKGKVVASVPQIGVVTLYLRSPYGILGVSLSFFFLFGGMLIVRMSERTEEEEEETLIVGNPRHRRRKDTRE